MHANFLFYTQSGISINDLQLHIYLFTRFVRTNCGTEEVQPAPQGPSSDRWMEGWVGAFRRGGRQRQHEENVRHQRGQICPSSWLRRPGCGLGVSWVTRQRPRTQGALHASAQGWQRSLGMSPVQARSQEGRGSTPPRNASTPAGQKPKIKNAINCQCALEENWQKIAFSVYQ